MGLPSTWPQAARENRAGRPSRCVPRPLPSSRYAASSLRVLIAQRGCGVTEPLASESVAVVEHDQALALTHDARVTDHGRIPSRTRGRQPRFIVAPLPCHAVLGNGVPQPIRAGPIPVVDARAAAVPHVEPPPDFQDPGPRKRLLLETLWNTGDIGPCPLLSVVGACVL